MPASGRSTFAISPPRRPIIKMKVLIVGLGSIGQRHARVLSKHFGAEIHAWRTRVGDAAPPDFEFRELASWDQVRALRLDAALVTNPTELHAITAIDCMKRGIRRIFLEKPIDCLGRRVRLLRAWRRRTAAAVYVAYPLRFHSAARLVRKRIRGRRIHHVRIWNTSWLPDWRPGRDYRKSYSADGRRGGGVLLDLSHEIDLVEYLTDQRIEKIEGRVSNSGRLSIRAEDNADLLLTLSGGGRANVHLSYASRRRERQLRVDYSDGCAEGDLLSGNLDDMYRRQLEYFFRAPAAELRKDFEEKARLTEMILRFRRSAMR